MCSPVASKLPVRLVRRVKDAPSLCSRVECCPAHQPWNRKWGRTTWLYTLWLEPTQHSPSPAVRSISIRYNVDSYYLQVIWLITYFTRTYVNVKVGTVGKVTYDLPQITGGWPFYLWHVLHVWWIKESPSDLPNHMQLAMGAVDTVCRCIKRNIKFVCHCTRLCKLQD